VELIMVQSAEHPELKFVEAKAYGKGRAGYSVMFSVIHYTAGSERATSAEDGAAYDARRTDGTSTHQFHDRDSTIDCVYSWNRANAARRWGNRLGIQHELCGTAQTREQWLDPASYGTLQQAARWVAEDCRKYNLPVRRLTVKETRRAMTEYPNGPRGIVGHVDCTLAFPEDGGDHTDPGKDFPWDIFLPMVQAELEGDDDMGTPIENAQALLKTDLGDAGGGDTVAVALQEGLRNSVKAVKGIAALQAASTAEAARDAQVAAILAGMQTALSSLAAASGALTPEQVARLTEQVEGAARAAGAEAVSALTAAVAAQAAKVDSLREHLGDDA
jgi:N-acetyl-anhydromuramyl-L-alanine amidase AmpD